jgi:hypothetical protein
VGFTKPLFDCGKTLDTYTKAVITAQFRWEVERLHFGMSSVVKGRR